MCYIWPQGLCCRNHRTKSPSRMLPDLLERKGRASHCQTFPLASFLIWHLAPEPGTQTGEALCLPTCLFLFPRPVPAPIWRDPTLPPGRRHAGGNNCHPFTLDDFPASQTHFIVTPRSRRRKSTCTRKLALPHGFSQADQCVLFHSLLGSKPGT